MAHQCRSQRGRTKAARKIINPHGAFYALSPKQTTLSEGDTVGLTGEVSIVHDDGKVTVWVKGFDYPLTIRAEHLSLIAKKGRK